MLKYGVMMGKALLGLGLAWGALCATGCVTGIIEKPKLDRLSYDKRGILRYEGEEVEGIKLKLPWHQELWPDNAPEWGFSLLTFGAGVGLGCVIADDSDGGDDGNDDADTTTPTTPSGDDGGGGGDDGGGDDGGDDGGGDDGGGGDDETPW